MERLLAMYSGVGWEPFRISPCHDVPLGRTCRTCEPLQRHIVRMNVFSPGAKRWRKDKGPGLCAGELSMLWKQTESLQAAPRPYIPYNAYNKIETNSHSLFSFLEPTLTIYSYSRNNNRQLPPFYYLYKHANSRSDVYFGSWFPSSCSIHTSVNGHFSGAFIHVSLVNCINFPESFNQRGTPPGTPLNLVVQRL